MALGYAWFDSYDSVGYVLTLHISPHAENLRHPRQPHHLRPLPQQKHLPPLGAELPARLPVA